MKGATIDKLSGIKLISNIYIEKKRKKEFVSISKCIYSLISYLLYDIKLSIFGLWTKQNIWGRLLGLWEAMIDICHNFRIFYRPENEYLIKKTTMAD